jgi:hypothetical protein
MWGKGFNYKNFQKSMPPVLISEFIEGLENLFNCRVFIKGNSVDIRFCENIITDPEYIEFSENVLTNPRKTFDPLAGFALTQTQDSNDTYADDLMADVDTKLYLGEVESSADLPELAASEWGDTWLVRDENSYYQDQPDDVGVGAWVNIGHAIEYLTPPIDENIVTSFGPVMNDTETDDVTIRYWDEEFEEWNPYPAQIIWNLPKVSNERGQYPEFSPRILFYRGIYEAEIDYVPIPGIELPDLHYPFATAFPYDPEGADIAEADLSMEWMGDKGLYNRFWRNWMEWYQHKKVLVEFQKILTAVEIKNLDFSKKYRVHGIDYLLKEIKIPITESGIGVATIEAYKV